MIEICTECKTSIAPSESPAVHTKTGVLAHQSCLRGADVYFFNEVPNLRASRMQLLQDAAKAVADKQSHHLVPLPLPVVPTKSMVAGPLKITPEDAAKHWVQSAVDQAVEPFNLQPNMINITAIGHSLGFLCRYTGNTKRFYSVAQHSVGVMRLVKLLGGGLKAQLWGLLHDSGESLLNDIASPLKSNAIFDGYRQLEHDIDSRIRRAFGLSIMNPEDLKLVRHCDMAMLAPEKKNLMGPEPRPWMPIPELVEAHMAFESVDAMVPHETPHLFKAVFLAEFERLKLEMSTP